MRVLIDVFFGLIYVSCILIYFRYFWKENPLKKYEEPLNDLKTEKSTS